MSLFLGGFDTGWTGYPPLSARAPVGMQMFFLGVFVAGWSSILGALNVIATVLRMRAKGMTAMRMPIFVWAAVATSIIALTATQFIGLSFQLVMFQRSSVWVSLMQPRAAILCSVPALVLVLFTPCRVCLYSAWSWCDL
jgi:cytochrome c oxidase subunit I